MDQTTVPVEKSATMVLNAYATKKKKEEKKEPRTEKDEVMWPHMQNLPGLNKFTFMYSLSDPSPIRIFIRECGQYVPVKNMRTGYVDWQPLNMPDFAVRRVNLIGMITTLETNVSQLVFQLNDGTGAITVFYKLTSYENDFTYRKRIDAEYDMSPSDIERITNRMTQEKESKEAQEKIHGQTQSKNHKVAQKMIHGQTQSKNHKVAQKKKYREAREKQYKEEQEEKYNEALEKKYEEAQEKKYKEAPKKYKDVQDKEDKEERQKWIQLRQAKEEEWWFKSREGMAGQTLEPGSYVDVIGYCGIKQDVLTRKGEKKSEECLWKHLESPMMIFNAYQVRSITEDKFNEVFSELFDRYAMKDLKC